MSDPTQGGTMETGLAPSWDAYTPQQLVQIINNGAMRYSATHPHYAQVRQLMQQARVELARQMAEQSHQDYLVGHDLGPVVAGIQNFGEGASLGLLGKNSPIAALRGVIDPQFTQAQQELHPLASGIGSGLGLGADIGILSPLATAAGLGTVTGSTVLGGGLGAAEGAIRAKPGERSAGAAAGGLGGAAVGAATGVAGKLLGGLVKGAGKVVGRALGRASAPGLLSREAAAAARAIGVQVGEEGEMIGGKTISEIRTALTKQKYGTPAQIDHAIDMMREQATRQASGGVTLTAKPGETLSRMPGTTQGFEVTGARKTPPVPTAPTITEIQDHLAGLRKRYTAHTAESLLPQGGELPQPSGGATLTPSSPKFAKTPAPSQLPDAWRPARQVSGPIQELQEKLGRALTPEELEKLHATLGPKVVPESAARNAHTVSTGMGQSPADATAAARRAAGHASTPWDPRIGL